MTATKIKVKLKYSPKVSEHVHQCHFFNWIRYAHPHILAFAIPNEQVRTTINKGDNEAEFKAMMQGKRMKAAGRLAGIPDIMIASANGVYHGLFIEMKTETGRMTESQKAIKAKLESEGYKVEMCQGWEQAVKITQEYLK